MKLDNAGSITRELVHTRKVVGHGFVRSDGLWDIECSLEDTKTYAFMNRDGRQREAGEPVHLMRVRLTIDEQMVVREAVAEMPNTPFPECPQGTAPFSRLIGARIGKGWRAAVNEAMGDVRGCTHLRELLGVMATVAFQATAGYRAKKRRENGEAAYSATVPGHQMGACLGWDFNGPVIARVAPQFIGWVKPAAD